MWPSSDRLARVVGHLAPPRASGGQTCPLPAGASCGGPRGGAGLLAPTTVATSAPGANGLVVWGAAHYRTNRVLWMLEELGVPYTHRPVDIREGSEEEIAELRRINPRSKIPALQDGQLVLAESAAILTYLADTYAPADGPAFIPEPRTPERAVHDMWMFYLMSEVDAQALYIHRKHVGLKHIYDEAPVAVEAAQRYWERQLAVIGDELRARPGEDFLLGSTFQACDVLLGHVLLWAVSLRWLPVEAQPEDTEVALVYLRRLVQRPGFLAAAALGAFPNTAALEELGRGP